MVAFLKSVRLVHLQKNVPTVHGMSVVVGDDPAIEELLESVLGSQFAGR